MKTRPRIQKKFHVILLQKKEIEIDKIILIRNSCMNLRLKSANYQKKYINKTIKSFDTLLNKKWCIFCRR